MPRFAANLTMLFTELPFLERFAAARQAGFDAVEFLFPYAWPAKQIRDLLDQHRLLLVLHNLPAGDWDAGERGIACMPERVTEFREGVELAISYAQALGVTQLNCLVGKAPDGLDPKLPDQTLVDNLSYAAAALQAHQIRLLIEPINTYDIPGFHLNSTAQALDLMARVRSDNLFLQYDIYHMQRTEGELAGHLQRHLERISHVQLADNPGRHEPGTGEIHWPFVFAHLDAIGYRGWVGCEYKPKTTTIEGLGWMQRQGKPA